MENSRGTTEMTKKGWWKMKPWLTYIKRIRDTLPDFTG